MTPHEFLLALEGDVERQRRDYERDAYFVSILAQCLGQKKITADKLYKRPKRKHEPPAEMPTEKRKEVLGDLKRRLEGGS